MATTKDKVIWHCSVCGWGGVRTIPAQLLRLPKKGGRPQWADQMPPCSNPECDNGTLEAAGPYTDADEVVRIARSGLQNPKKVAWIPRPGQESPN